MDLALHKINIIIIHYYLSIKCQHKTQHTVSRGMLRPEVDGDILHTFLHNLWPLCEHIDGGNYPKMQCSTTVEIMHSFALSKNLDNSYRPYI